MSPGSRGAEFLIYQIHDGSVQAIDAVYDKGSALTAGSDYLSYAALAAASITAGQYGTCKALGLFKLGSAAAGQITADVQGENAAGFIEKTADIVEWALLTSTVLEAADLDEASFAAVNIAQPAPIDYFVGPDDNLTVAAFIQTLMRGIGGWGGHKLDGTFEVRIFSAPTGTPLARFNRGDMLGGDIKREPLPSAYQPPRYRWRVPYERNWTVQKYRSGRRRQCHSPRVSCRGVSPRGSNQRHDSDRSSLFAGSRAFAGILPPASRRGRGSNAAVQPVQDDARDLPGDRPAPRPSPRYRRRNRVTHPRFDLSQGRAMILVETAVSVVVADGAIDNVEVAAYG